MKPHWFSQRKHLSIISSERASSNHHNQALHFYPLILTKLTSTQSKPVQWIGQDSHNPTACPFTHCSTWFTYKKCLARTKYWCSTWIHAKKISVHVQFSSYFLFQFYSSRKFSRNLSHHSSQNITSGQLIRLVDAVSGWYRRLPTHI